MRLRLPMRWRNHLLHPDTTITPALPHRLRWTRPGWRPCVATTTPATQRSHVGGLRFCNGVIAVRWCGNLDSVSVCVVRPRPSKSDAIHDPLHAEEEEEEDAERKRQAQANKMRDKDASTRFRCDQSQLFGWFRCVLRVLSLVALSIFRHTPLNCTVKTVEHKFAQVGGRGGEFCCLICAHNKMGHKTDDCRRKRRGRTELCFSYGSRDKNSQNLATHRKQKPAPSTEQRGSERGRD